ncbi:hypothetical protein ACWDPV_22670 [Gordonia sp. NPDC003504]
MIAMGEFGPIVSRYSEGSTDASVQTRRAPHLRSNLRWVQVPLASLNLMVGEAGRIMFCEEQFERGNLGLHPGDVVVGNVPSLDVAVEAGPVLIGKAIAMAATAAHDGHSTRVDTVQKQLHLSDCRNLEQ